MASGDLDLWEMNLDGSGKKQITKTYGYDGGPVFSRDGKKIAWRADHPTTPETKKKYADLLHENLTSPMKMELFVADADGKNAKQITNFGCASFAPTFTPDGKQILFASNKHACDSSKFELFLINVDGTGLKQVTNYGGFTSFPEYSPGRHETGLCLRLEGRPQGTNSTFSSPIRNVNRIVLFCTSTPIEALVLWITCWTAPGTIWKLKRHFGACG